ncbi:MAG: C40 family peptidase [Spirochaetaceae bacterium]|jgi:cell wall-associated NlpC family hydrolase|nr:C40 family peptidase [Spirochaetaceae bacterium]
MIPSWASRYVGIPFVSGGRESSGCDCYGLIRLVLLEQFACQLPLLALGYKNACDAAETGPLIQRYLPLLKGGQITKPAAGSVPLIRYRGRTSHVGIFVDDEYILHTLPKIGAHCVDAGHLFLRGAIEGIYCVDTDYSITQSL